MSELPAQPSFRALLLAHPSTHEPGCAGRPLALLPFGLPIGHCLLLLKGRARNASSAKQRRYLEGLARDLEEPCIPHPAQVRASPVGRVSPPRFTSQLGLFAGASP